MTITEALASCVGNLGTLKFFPSDPDSRAAIGTLVLDMCSTPEQAEWLGKRMIVLFNEWPGPQELRACFCSRFRPRDGIELYSRAYADGIPSESEQRNLELEGSKAVAARGLIEARDPEAAALVRRVSDGIQAIR